MKKFILILLFAPLLTVNGKMLGISKDQLVLRGGFNITGTRVLTGDHSATFPGIGINTQFGHLWTKWELTLSSYAFVGRVNDIGFEFDDEQVHGSGALTSVSFIPLLKYYTKFSYNPKYSFYIGAGPIWSIETIKLSESSRPGREYEIDHKLIYESAGVFIAVGLHDKIKKKKDHPIFYELAYSYQKAYNISYADITDRAKIKMLREQRTRQLVTGHTFFFGVGFTIF